MKRATLGSLLLVFLTHLLSFSVAEVTYQSNEFTHEPSAFYYFPKSTNILMKDKSNGFWTSLDEGKTWQSVNMQNEGLYIVGHPYSDRRAMIVGSTSHMLTKDYGKTFFETETPVQAARPTVEFGYENHRAILFYGKDCPSCATDLYLSTDFGTNWNKIAKDVEMCKWGKTSQFSSLSNNTIYCIMNFGDESRFVRSSDNFNTHTVLIDSQSYAFQISGAYLLVATENIPGDCASCGSLHVSKDGDEFSLAQFPPTVAKAQYSYNVIKSLTPRVLLGVSTDSLRRWGTLVESDSTGVQFVTALEHVKINGAELDLKRIDSVPGTVLSNVISNYNEVSSGEEEKIVTKISYDDGSIWGFIQSSEVSSSCSRNQECSIHFHRRTERHPEGLITSSSSAPGMAMGVGNVGEYLEKYENCQTYLTRDGGRNWKKVLDGPYLYQFADQGSILVVANDKDPRKYLRYSSDGGKNWSKQDFYTNDIIVKGILTEPKSTSRKVIIVGTISNTTSTKKYIISHVDFTNLLTRKCESSDFEKFSPGTDCVMGQKLTYLRRKETADCYIGNEYQDPTVEVTNCECTQDDFECDYGFKRIEDGTCVREGKEPPQPDDCIPGEEYFVSSGYRKIPGNQCIQGSGGVWYTPIRKICQGSVPTSAPTTPPGGEQSLIQKFMTSFADSIVTYKYMGTTGVILALDSKNKVFRSANEGRTWSPLEFSEPIKSIELPASGADVAIFLSSKTSHWITYDNGQTIKPLNVNAIPISSTRAISFHPTMLTSIIFIGVVQNGQNRYREAFITKNGGETWSSLNTYIDSCFFLKQVTLPTFSIDDIYCSEYPEKSGVQFIQPRILKLYKSVDFFKTKASVLDSVIDFIIYSKYIVAVVREDDESNHLYTSVNGTDFVSAKFPKDLQIEENGYFLHKSAKEAIYVDVFSHDTPSGNMGTLLISNSIGTEFSLSLTFTNRNEKNKVDFERMEGLRGVLISNRIVNPDQVIDGEEKIIESVISFNDGGNWYLINAPSKNLDGNNYPCKGLSKCTLHIHSVTETTQPGMVYSASSAIGLMMAVGNVGAYLLPYSQGNTYITRDGGVSWKEVLKGPHLYEFADRGSILVAIQDGKPTNTLSYSWDEGDSWKSFTFTSRPVNVKWITTESGSASLKILIMAEYTNDTTKLYETIQVDFSGLHKKKCDESDFEDWTPTGAAGICLFGKKVTYTRRKQTSECYIGEKDFETVKSETVCECTESDFECAYDHVLENNKCVLASWADDQPDYCTGTYVAPSGYVKVPGTECKNGLKLDQPITKTCKEISKVKKAEKSFSGYRDYYYFENSDVVFFLDSEGLLWRSTNEGTDWTLANVKDVVAIIPHPTKKSTVFLLTDSRGHFYTTNEGQTFNMFEAPVRRSYNVPIERVLSLHPDEQSWILFTGDACQDGSSTATCQHDDTYYSADTGKTWKKVESYVEKCVWGKTLHFDDVPKSTIYCTSHSIKSGLQDNLYKNPSDTVHFLSYDSPNSIGKTILTDVVGFETFNSFMAIGTQSLNSAGLQLYISLDGERMNKASFPQSVSGDHYGYSFLESSTGTVFMDIFTSNFLVGVLLTSDSTGYRFSVSLDNLNQNLAGVSDFEKFQGLKGIILANVVANPEGGPKVLHSLISFDNGGRWTKIPYPSVDANGNLIKCNGCSLHLVGPTGLPSTPEGYHFTSSSAVGLAMAIGNVGTQLTPYSEGNTYLTNDAGLTWKEVRKGPHLFAFGDRGAIIVIVNDKDLTNHVRYSWNEGKTWENYDFSETKVRAVDLITETDSTSEKFILIAKKPGDDKVYTYTIDFTDLHERTCSDNDFEYWTPTDHVGGSCILGEKITYQRRKADAECAISSKFSDPVVSTTKCTCQDIDFECDLDYYLDGDECIPLYEVSQPAICPVGSTYKTPSGFRKVPENKCVGGVDLTASITKNCRDITQPTTKPTTKPTTTPTESPTEKPTKSPSSSKGLSIGAWVAIVVIPIVVLIGIFGVLVYKRYSGEFRIPRIFRNIRYSRINANDNIENLVDDYEL